MEEPKRRKATRARPQAPPPFVPPGGAEPLAIDSLRVLMPRGWASPYDVPLSLRGTAAWNAIFARGWAVVEIQRATRWRRLPDGREIGFPPYEKATHTVPAPLVFESSAAKDTEQGRVVVLRLTPAGLSALEDPAGNVEDEARAALEVVLEPGDVEILRRLAERPGLFVLYRDLAGGCAGDRDAVGTRVRERLLPHCLVESRPRRGCTLTSRGLKVLQRYGPRPPR